MTACAKIFFCNDDAVLFALINGAGGTDHDAWGVSTVKAGHREESDSCGRILSFFQSGDMSKGRPFARQIILVKTGDHARHTASTPKNIKRETKLHP
jgi:hypothetical protein